MGIGIPNIGYPELFSGTHPYCLKWFPIQWMDENGVVNFVGNGVAILGQPIVGWRAWTNPSQTVDSIGATIANPKLDTVPNGILCINWFHQKPWCTTHNSKEVYELPDFTTRTSTNANLSDNAWIVLQEKLMADTWPV